MGNKFVEAFDDPSPSVVGFVTSIFDIGCFIGSIITMAVGDAFGRKRCMYLGAIIMGGGAIFQVISWAIIVLSWSRAITGVGIGIMTATAPLYHSEMVKAHMRGKAVVIELLINIVGYVVSNWTTLAFSHWRTTTLQWRIPLGIQLGKEPAAPRDSANAPASVCGCHYLHHPLLPRVAAVARHVWAQQGGRRRARAPFPG